MYTYLLGLFTQMLKQHTNKESQYFSVDFPFCQYLYLDLVIFSAIIFVLVYETVLNHVDGSNSILLEI